MSDTKKDYVDGYQIGFNVGRSEANVNYANERRIDRLVSLSGHVMQGMIAAEVDANTKTMLDRAVAVSRDLLAALESLPTPEPPR